MFITLLTFLYGGSIIAQNLSVSYQQIFESTDISLDKRYDLIITDSVSVYIETDSKTSEVKKIHDTPDTNTYVLNTVVKTDNNVYYNNREEMVFIETFFGEALAIREEKETIQHKWEHIDSTKTIGGFTCKLATTEFRGRKYYAWYTEEIPTNFGPWKLTNLNGLILQAHDEKNVFTLNALKINTIPVDQTDSALSLINKTKQEIKNKKKIFSIAELKVHLDDKNKATLSRIQQQLPRGTKMPALDKDCEDCDGLEIY